MLKELTDLPHAKAKIDALKALEYRAGIDNGPKDNLWSAPAQKHLDARNNPEATVVCEAGAASVLDL